jgi:DNA-binding GntR family transcriptional regulator
MSDATDGFPLDAPARNPLLPAAPPRESTSRVIAEALRAAIVDGTLAPGAPLRQLESEGWARAAVHKGATVAPLSADEAREIYEIRSALESLALGLAIPLHSAATLRESTALCYAAERESNPSLYVERNAAFHMSLYAPAGRPQLEEMIGTLHRRGERYLRLKFGLPSYKGESDNEHAALLDAVQRGDIPTAQSLVVAHLLGTGDLLHRFLTERAQAEAALAIQPKPRGRRPRTTSGS